MNLTRSNVAIAGAFAAVVVAGGIGCASGVTARQTPNAAFTEALSHTSLRDGKPVVMIGYGHELCSDLDGGQTVAEVGTYNLVGSVPAPTWHEFATIAVRNFCPQNADLL